MAVCYNKLWKLLVDKKMSKADLRRQAFISSNTMTKLNRDDMVALPILDRICHTLDVDYGDIMEHVNELSSDENERDSINERESNKSHF